VTGLAPTIGREDDLTRLRAAFQAATPPVVRVLTGMGGVGKTSLARAYTDRHRSDYGLVWWVRAEDPNAIDAEFRALLDTVLPPGQATQLTNARTKAFDLLAKQHKPWLLVLDNVPAAPAADSLVPPAGPGHVLITSQATTWPDPKTLIPVRPLDLEASVELLTSLSLDHDRESAEALAAELDGLPLALAQAAGFIRTNAIDLATYLRLYRSTDLHQDGRPADYPHTVATTWQLAMDRLSESARFMLNVLAFYAPDAIPVHRLFASFDELARHRAVGELHAYSLITPSGSDTVTIHRLVQATTRNRLRVDLTSHEWAEKARVLITAALPEHPLTAVTLATWHALRTHVQALVDYLPPEHPDTLCLRHEFAAWTGWAGDAARARDLFAELFPIRKKVLGAEHPHTLVTHYSLGRWTGNSGDPVTARDLFAELLQIRERTLGAEHPDTLKARQALAARIGQAGDPARARDLYAELIPVRRRVLGADHLLTLTAQHSLACWTGTAGDAVGARDLLAEVILTMQRVLGAGHPDTLFARGHLARWIGAAGDAIQAQELLAEQVQVETRVLGAQHPHTLYVREEFAFWTEKAGDAVQAQQLLAELREIQKRVLGDAQLDTVVTRHKYWTG
jgi:AAA ATPase domain/Tetratricopeptide repeat